MDWWFIDRYPDRYPISREEALAQGMAVVFNTDLTRLAGYADYRARAMVLQDEAEVDKKESDWELVESLLIKSYEALSRGV